MARHEYPLDGKHLTHKSLKTVNYTNVRLWAMTCIISLVILIVIGVGATR